MARTTIENQISSRPEFGAVVSTRLNIMKKNHVWLAKKCGISYAYLIRIVNGQKKPSLRLIEKIAILINVDITDLVLTLVYKEK